MRPTKEQVAGAEGRTLPDIIGRDLNVLFCGINPGLYSADIGCHFGRPGNRFWKALHASGFTDRLLEPAQQYEMAMFGCGLTNIVERATARANQLTADELKVGAERLLRKAELYEPSWVAVLGIGAYRTAFGRKGAALGVQTEKLGPSRLWVLPNPSGLNAHYQEDDLARLFGELRRASRRKR